MAYLKEITFLSYNEEKLCGLELGIVMNLHMSEMRPFPFVCGSKGCPCEFIKTEYIIMLKIFISTPANTFSHLFFNSFL